MKVGGVMNRTEYKNNFYKEHYERINLAVPKGMKEIIKGLASDKGMSVNAYIQDLVRKDQCGLFDTMQIAEKNREMLSGITGNMHNGYDIIFKDGHSCHCRTKKDVRSCIIEYCKEKGGSIALFFHVKGVLHKISKVLHKTPVFVLVTCVLPVSYRNIFVCFEVV